MSLTPYAGPGPELPEGYTAEAWEVSVENADANGSYSVRYLTPPDAKPDETVIYVLQDDGSWQQVDVERSGSYLVFPVERNPVVFSASSPGEEKNSFPVIPVAAGGGALLAVLLLLLARNRRKKKAP